MVSCSLRTATLTDSYPRSKIPQSGRVRKFGTNHGAGVTVRKIGVPLASKIKVGVMVAVLVGARVGMGAWVGVATSVLAGKCNVGGAVGAVIVGGGARVGNAKTTVAGGGVATKTGRITKLVSPKT